MLKLTYCRFPNRGICSLRRFLFEPPIFHCGGACQKEMKNGHILLIFSQNNQANEVVCHILFLFFFPN